MTEVNKKQPCKKRGKVHMNKKQKIRGVVFTLIFMGIGFYSTQYLNEDYSTEVNLTALLVWCICLTGIGVTLKDGMKNG